MHDFTECWQRSAPWVVAPVDGPVVRLGRTTAIAGSGKFRDLISGRTVACTLEDRRRVQTVERSRWRLALLVEE